MSRIQTNKSNGLTKSWDFYVQKKLAQGWVLNKSVMYNLQFLTNPNPNAEVTKISYVDYSKVIKLMFKNATTYLIEGEPLSLQGNGIIKARRIEKDETKLLLSKPTINKFRTKSREQVIAEGVKYITYGDRVKIHWSRPYTDESKHFLKNYRFHIARDNNGTGFKERFSNANTSDLKLKYKYDFFATKNFII